MSLFRRPLQPSDECHFPITYDNEEDDVIMAPISYSNDTHITNHNIHCDNDNHNNDIMICTDDDDDDNNNTININTIYEVFTNSELVSSIFEHLVNSWAISNQKNHYPFETFNFALSDLIFLSMVSKPIYNELQQSTNLWKLLHLSCHKCKEKISTDDISFDESAFMQKLTGMSLQSLKRNLIHMVYGSKERLKKEHQLILTLSHKKSFDVTHILESVTPIDYILAVVNRDNDIDECIFRPATINDKIGDCVLIPKVCLLEARRTEDHLKAQTFMLKSL